jgi:hypothetical protein
MLFQEQMGVVELFSMLTAGVIAAAMVLARIIA